MTRTQEILLELNEIDQEYLQKFNILENEYKNKKNLTFSEFMYCLKGLISKYKKEKIQAIKGI